MIPSSWSYVMNDRKTESFNGKNNYYLILQLTVIINFKHLVGKLIENLNQLLPFLSIGLTATPPSCPSYLAFPKCTFSCCYIYSSNLYSPFGQETNYQQFFSLIPKIQEDAVAVIRITCLILRKKQIKIYGVWDFCCKIIMRLRKRKRGRKDGTVEVSWKNNYKMKLSGPEEGGKGFSDVAQSGQMEGLLGPVHALGRKHAGCDLLPQKVGDERAGDAAVEALLIGWVERFLLRASAHQLSQGVLIHIVIHLAPNHRLVEVEALGTPPLSCFAPGENSLYYTERLSLLLNEGQDEPDDVGHNIPILELLGFFRPFAKVGFGTIVLVLRNAFWFRTQFYIPRTSNTQQALPEVFPAWSQQDRLSDSLLAEVRVLFLLRCRCRMHEFCGRQDPILTVGKEIVGVDKVKLHKGGLTIGQQVITKYYISIQFTPLENTTPRDLCPRPSHSLLVSISPSVSILSPSLFFRFLLVIAPGESIRECRAPSLRDVIEF